MWRASSPPIFGGKMEERKLVKVVQVDDVLVHDNADSLEIAIIGGWQCVVRKGEFSKGDYAVYFEIDSMLPLTSPRFESFAGRNEYVVDGTTYTRIRTMKLRKELSQGLLMNLSVLGELSDTKTKGEIDLLDLDEILGVIKYEAPVSANLAGNAKGSFPSFIPKTDQERVQNLSRKVQGSQGHLFEVSYKLDGSSFTAYCNEDEEGVYTGVCSRNLELKVDETNEGNSFVKAFKDSNLDELLRQWRAEGGDLIAFQGELLAPNIQGNFEGVSELTLYVYAVYNISKREYMLPNEAEWCVKSLGLKYVPVFLDRYKLDKDVKGLLELADGDSGLNGKFREGLVFKSLSDPEFSFKAISNRYLLKTGK